MERVLKYVILSVFLISGLSGFAEQLNIQPVSVQSPVKPITVQAIKMPQGVTPAVATSATIPQIVSFEKCSKTFITPVDKLFFLSLASINANRFEINEIQSKSGYILFTAANRQFLAIISEISPKASSLKIVPADNNYYFPIGVVSNFFKYVELNLATPIEKLS
jgi:hypothetical protein